MALLPSGPPASINLPAPAVGSGQSGVSGNGPGIPNAPDSPAVAENLRKAEAALHAALQGEQDPQDKAVISSLLAKLHTIEAGHAKEADAAMGIGAPQKFIRRQQSQQGNGGY